MPELLKNLYNQDFFRQIKPAFEKSIPDIDYEDFLNQVLNEEWPSLELKQRMRHIASALHDQLPGDYNKQVNILINLSEELKNSGIPNIGLLGMFLTDFIDQYGRKETDISLKAMENLTQLSSAEFCIRPFLAKHPEKVLRQVYQWKEHANEHVRRLASEGMRPRLPWGMSVAWLKHEPEKILPVLNTLIDDSSEYVRRSVSNNLNDISKDHPDLVIAFVKEHINKSKEKNKALKHACRTLLKKGVPEAMGLFGYEDFPFKVLKCVPEKEKVKIGDTLNFSIHLEGRNDQEVLLRMEYAVYYRKARGQYSKKVFKVCEKMFAGKEVFKRKLSFADLTTRKHYPGTHRLSLIMNGIEQKPVAFEVVK